MQCIIARTIGEFAASEWDRLIGDNPLSSHRFVEVLEKSGIPGAEFFHLMFVKDGLPVACTSLYSHPFDFDLIAPPAVRKSCGLLRKVSDNFLRSRVLFCGLPISLGRSHFGFHPGLEPRDHALIWKLLYEALDRLAAERGIPILGAKEFDRRGPGPIIGALAPASGFACGHSPPTVTLKIEWPTFDEYLASLRASYRRQALADIRRGRETEIAFNLHTPAEFDAATAYALYENVFARAKDRLEKLTPAFFNRLGEAFPDAVRYIVGEHRGRPVAFALMFEDRTTSHFLFAGLDYRHVRTFGIYRNLLLQVVRHAVVRRSSLLELGQTSYDIKQRIGGTLRPLVFYVKHRSPAAQWFLQRAAPVFFPEVGYEGRNVFRQNHRLPGDERRPVPPIHGVPEAVLPQRSELDPAA